MTSTPKFRVILKTKNKLIIKICSHTKFDQIWSNHLSCRVQQRTRHHSINHIFGFRTSLNRFFHEKVNSYFITVNYSFVKKVAKGKHNYSACQVIEIDLIIDQKYQQRELARPTLSTPDPQPKNTLIPSDLGETKIWSREIYWNK